MSDPCHASADREGLVQDAPPLGDELAQDPALAALKLVAWPADDTLLPRAGERGFPHWGRWAERNKRFTRDVVQWFAQGALQRSVCRSVHFELSFGDAFHQAPGRGLISARQRSHFSYF